MLIASEGCVDAHPFWIDIFLADRRHMELLTEFVLSQSR